VILNNGPAPCTVRVPVSGTLPEGAHAVDLLGNERCAVRDGHLAGATVPARDGLVLQVT
jgi:hypothetical protein